MTRHSTLRLMVAALATSIGAIVAIMTGRTDAAILVTPWVVLLVLGLSGARRQRVRGSVSADVSRVVTGDAITVRTKVSGARGWVRVTSRPDIGFFAPDAATDTGRPSDPANPADPSEAAEDETLETPAQTAAESEDGVDRFSVADVLINETAELTCSLTASAWGTHDVGHVGIEINEPYGLLRWTGSLRSPIPVRVHPRPTDLDELLVPWLVRRLAGAHDSPAVGQGVEFADLRPFGAGDALRDINWRASARSNELWVSQRHPEQSTEVVLFLDTFIESGHEIRRVLGLAIEAAIALAESHLAATDRVGLIELGGIIRWVSPRTGRIQLQQLVDALLATQLYENSAERDLAIVPPRALPPRSFVVALSPLLDERFIRALFILRAAGHDVSVIECPPILDGDESSSQRSDVFPVAKKLWQAERDMTTDRLAAQGVAVGRWIPGDGVQQAVAELVRRRRGARAVLRR